MEGTVFFPKWIRSRVVREPPDANFGPIYIQALEMSVISTVEVAILTVKGPKKTLIWDRST